MKRELRDRMNRLIGTISAKANGQFEGRDYMGRLKGTYDPQRDETRDVMGRLVGKGDHLASLISE